MPRWPLVFTLATAALLAFGHRADLYASGEWGLTFDAAATFLLLLAWSWFVVRAYTYRSRAQAAEALRASEEQFRAAFDHSTVGRTLTSVDGRLMRVNPAFCEMLGDTPEWLTGRMCVDITHPDDVGRTKEAMQRLLAAEEQAWRSEKRYLRRDGTVVYADVSTTLVRDTGGRARHFITDAVDITERKKAEASLEEREQRIRLQTRALEAAANAVVVTDVAGTIVWVNPAFSRLTGYTAEEAIGRDTRLLKSGAQDPAFYAGLWSTIVSGGTWSGEMVNRRKDGTLYTEEMTITPVPAGDGSITHFVAIKQDVTERRQAEAALRVAQRRLQHVVTSSPAVLFSLRVVDGELQGRWISENVQRLVGYTPKETASPDWWINHLHPEDRERARAEVATLLKAGQLVQEYRFRNRQGEYRWLRSDVCLLRDAAGEPREAIGSWSDITDRKDTELRLQESERKYRVLFESNPHPMYLFDATSFGFLAVNQAMVHHYGYSRDELLRMTVLDIRPPDAIPRLLQVMASASTEHPPAQRLGLFVHRKKDGTLMDMDVAATRVSLPSGVAWLALAMDVTEKRSLEAQLLQAQKMESVGRLAGGVAHDFNNLLGVITGYGELLQRRLGSDARLGRYVGDILKAASRAGDLTRQLLAFSRKQVLQPKILDLNAVVGDMERMLRRLIGEDIQLVTRLEEHLGPVKADPGQIEQVLMNLAVNARDAISKGGSLTIETSNVALDEVYARQHPGVAAGAYATLSVRDTGHGMPPEVRARVFEPFFTTKEAGKGTGLGLATVHGIVKQSGGHITVESEPGRGTCFRIHLPRTDVARGKEAETAPEDRPLPGGSETILVVEDEESVRGIVRESLEASGYTLLEAANGAEALELVSRHAGPIDLLLTDVVMPGMGGRELAQKLRDVQPQVQTLYMSGYTDDAVVRHGIEAETMSFLQKPFNVPGLARKVREVLDQPR
jgi:PAS domain S-box-containing protein